MHNIELIIDIAVLSMDSNSGSSSSFMIPMGGMFFGSSSTETKLNVDFDIQMYDVVKKETIYRGTATCKDENDDISDCIENIFKSLASSLVSQYFTKPTDKK